MSTSPVKYYHIYGSDYLPNNTVKSNSGRKTENGGLGKITYINEYDTAYFSFPSDNSGSMSYVEDKESDYLLKEIEEKLKSRKLELQVKIDSEKGAGAILDNVKGIFGYGTKREIKDVENLRQKLQELKSNSNKSDIQDLYKKVFLSEPDFDTVKESVQVSESINNGTFTVDGQSVSKEDIIEKLAAQVGELKTNFNEMIDSQGIFSKGLGLINNVLGFGTTENMTNAAIDEYAALIKKLDEAETPEETAALYKSITGEDLTSENIKRLMDGESFVGNSFAAEAVMDYEETQKTALTAFSGVIIGAATAAAPFTGGASLVAGAVIGAGINVGIKCIDTVTREHCNDVKGNMSVYIKENFVKDMLSGAVNGFSNVVGNKIGGKLAKGFASKKLGTEVVETMGERAVKQSIGTGTRILTEFADGAADGAISNGAEYLIDSATGGTKFDFKVLKNRILLGGAMGGVMSAGMQETTAFISAGAGKAFSYIKNTDEFADGISDVFEKESRDIITEGMQKTGNEGIVENISEVTAKKIDADPVIEAKVQELKGLIDSDDLIISRNNGKLSELPADVQKQYTDALEWLSDGCKNVDGAECELYGVQAKAMLERFNNDPEACLEAIKRLYSSSKISTETIKIGEVKCDIETKIEGLNETISVKNPQTGKTMLSFERVYSKDGNIRSVSVKDASENISRTIDYEYGGTIINGEDTVDVLYSFSSDGKVYKVTEDGMYTFDEKTGALITTGKRGDQSAINSGGRNLKIFVDDGTDIQFKPEGRKITYIVDGTEKSIEIPEKIDNVQDLIEKMNKKGDFQSGSNWDANDFRGKTIAVVTDKDGNVLKVDINRISNDNDSMNQLFSYIYRPDTNRFNFECAEMNLLAEFIGKNGFDLNDLSDLNIYSVRVKSAKKGIWETFKNCSGCAQVLRLFGLKDGNIPTIN